MHALKKFFHIHGHSRNSIKNKSSALHPQTQHKSVMVAAPPNNSVSSTDVEYNYLLPFSLYISTS